VVHPNWPIRQPTWDAEPMTMPTGTHRLQTLNRIGTALFVVTAVVAVLGSGTVRTGSAIVAVVLFAVGTVAMLLAFLRGVDRSRTEQVSVASLFLLMGSVPTTVRREFHLLTALQTVVGVATAAMEPFTSLAFGILVPMLGLGLSSLWAASYGMFSPREDLDHKRPEHARPTTPPAPTAANLPATESEELHNG